MIDGFVENFGPLVETICLVLLAVLGACLCCRGLVRAYRCLKAQLGGVEPLTRVVLFALCVSFAPFAASKFAGGVNRAGAPSSSSPPRLVTSPFAPSSPAPALAISDFALTPSSVVFGVSWPLGALTSDSLVWILARTNLVDGAWEPVRCTVPGLDVPPLGIEIPFADLPGAADGTPPMSAFFAAEAQILADADRDGVPDLDETGWVEFGMDLPAFDFASAVETISLYDAAEDYWRYSLPAVPLPFTVWCGGVPSTNAVALANGVVGFLAAGREGRWLLDDTWNADFANENFVYSDDHAVVAACWSNLYALPDSGAAIRAATFGTAPERWFVVEYRKVSPSARVWDAEPPSATFQFAVSEVDPSMVHVRYLALSNGFDFASATLGAQGAEGLPTLPVAYNVAAAATNGMVVSYHFGLGSDPHVSDTDGDGLNDGEEVHLGTSPRLVDTDGDGLPDKWELDRGLDPLSAEGDDGRDGDPDRDDLANWEEYEWNTDPSSSDTDGDGRNDGAEVDAGSDPADSVDQVLEQWVKVRGDLGEDVEKRETRTLTIPAGRTVLACVFLASEEYPKYTGDQSRFNDAVSWRLEADGGGFSGSSTVNALDPAWDSAAAAGHSACGLSPVVVQDARFISAPTNAALEVAVTLTAKNVGDGLLPSTVAVGLFPLRVEQRNMPAATGVGGSTDAGTAAPALIPDFGTAYVTGAPAAADLVARIKGLLDWLRVTWETLLTAERSERGARDDRMARPVELRGASDYLISSELGNEIVGGRCALTMAVGGFPPKTVQFFIRGKNPRDAVARAYIDANVDPEFRDYAWMIAKHESWAASTRQIYNQFNPSGDKKELPNLGAPDGWGMCQIDRSGNDPQVAINYTTTAETYDWHENIAAMNATLRQKRGRYNEIIGLYRMAYQHDPSTRWFEPDGVTTNVNGTVMSARQWSIMTLYNGAGGTHPIPFAGQARRSTPIHFDPVSTNWVLFTNRENYVPKVLGKANADEAE